MRSLVITVFVVGCGLAAWAMDNPYAGSWKLGIR